MGGLEIRWFEILVLAAFVATTGCDDSTGNGVGDGVLGEWVWSGGVERTYVLHLPPSYDPAQASPLLVLLHGGGDTGAGFQQRLDADGVADQAGLITIYPDIDFTQRPDDAPFIRTLIAHLKARLAIDPLRVYVAGLSGGAELTHTLACDDAGILAGAASVGYPMRREVARHCEPQRPLSVLFMHGTEDGAAPWDGFEDVLKSVPGSARKWALLNECTLEPAPEKVWLPDLADDSTRVWVKSYTGCAAGVEVNLYGVEGGGHSWPGAPGPFPVWKGSHSMDINASEEIVNFFMRYPASSSAKGVRP